MKMPITGNVLTNDLVSLEQRHSSGIYAKREINIVHGKGALLWDDHGREYIDCISGHGVANVGHSHPRIINAIQEQAEQLIVSPPSFYNNQRAIYLEKLTQQTPKGLQRVFLSNSGTEAVEAGIKFARYSTGRTEIIAAMRGFHGRTLGSLSATWNRKYRTPFLPLVPNFKHIPYNNLDKLQAIISENTAAVILEVVQGEGGVHPGTQEFLMGAQQLCREKGCLLILDEVQTGFGRTGKMFALEHYELEPDILCLAKSIAGGIPMGATILGERVKPLTPGIHGSTFGGNPLAVSAAIATLEVLQSEQLISHASAMGKYLIKELRNLESPLIREVRGLGLMVGLELRKKAAPYIADLAEQGVLVLSAGMTVIRLLPPLVITKEQLDKVINKIALVLKPN